MQWKKISETPIINGTKKFPKPPINIGITIKKIIKNRVYLKVRYFKPITLYII